MTTLTGVGGVDSEAVDVKLFRDKHDFVVGVLFTVLPSLRPSSSQYTSLSDLCTPPPTDSLTSWLFYWTIHIEHSYSDLHHR